MHRVQLSATKVARVSRAVNKVNKFTCQASASGRCQLSATVTSGVSIAAVSPARYTVFLHFSVLSWEMR